MLKANEINFPITFNDCANGLSIKFYSATSNCVWSCGDKSSLSLSYFIKFHNEHNQHNKIDERYRYAMAAKKEKKREDNDLVGALNYLNINPGQMNFNGAVFAASMPITNCDMICNIEDMPVGATIKGIKNDDEEFDAITFTAKRVEIYDDVITLLSGYAGGSMPKRTQTYAAELNIKRGTLVKYSTNC